MSEYMLIHYIPGQQDNILYWALGGDQHPSITLGHGKLSELEPIARGKNVRVLFDSHYTTLKSVKVPSKNRQKQLLAIPFAMEDFLAEDIEDTHFALGKSNADGEVPVVAINRELLRSTLALFAEHHVRINSITPDAMAMPCTENNWCILLNADNAIINCANIESHNCDISNLQLILDALLEQAKTKPESITYYHQAAETHEPTLFDKIDIPCTEKTFQNHALEIFAGSTNGVQSINLLQGEFTPKRESNHGWLQPWKLAASVSGIWIVLYLAYTSILSSQLEDQNLSLAKNIETEFRRAIPDAKQMTNMQKRVEQQLKDLKSAGSASQNNGFLQILSATAPTLAENNKININATVYRNNYIDIDLSATSLQDIEQVKNKLLDIQKIKTTLSTTVEKDTVKGRLRLEAKG